MLKSDEIRYKLRDSLNPVISKSLHSISKNFARKVTSKHNQHVSCMTVGGTGMGKSSSNIMLGINTAKHIANYVGGKWYDYYNLDHIGILTKDEIYRVIEIDKKYAVIQPDDVGAAWNARKWADEGNIMMNDIAQTSRTENQVVLMTLPDTILLDKVPRVLCHNIMTMEPPHFDMGVTVGKFFRIVRKPREDKTFFMYEDLGGLKYQKTLFARPPDMLIIPYEKRRYEIAHKMKQDALEEKRLREEEKKQPQAPKITKKERILELYRDVQAGVFPDLREALKSEKTMNIDHQYAKNVISSYLNKY